MDLRRSFHLIFILKIFQFVVRRCLDNIDVKKRPTKLVFKWPCKGQVMFEEFQAPQRRLKNPFREIFTIGYHVALPVNNNAHTLAN